MFYRFFFYLILIELYHLCPFYLHSKISFHPYLKYGDSAWLLQNEPSCILKFRHPSCWKEKVLWPFRREGKRDDIIVMRQNNCRHAFTLTIEMETFTSYVFKYLITPECVLFLSVCVYAQNSGRQYCGVSIGRCAPLRGAIRPAKWSRWLFVDKTLQLQQKFI